jgi:hypothetical protein
MLLEVPSFAGADLEMNSGDCSEKQGKSVDGPTRVWHASADVCREVVVSHVLNLSSHP